MGERSRWAAALLLGVLTSAGCDDEEEVPPPAITFGAIFSTTGDLASIGLQELQAATLAVNEINAAGGVLGKQLALSKYDDGTDPARAATAAEALKGEGVPVVFGAIGSSFTLAAAAVLSPAGIVGIAGASTSPAITGFEDNGFLFRTCPSDAFQSKLLASRARARGLSRIAVINLPGAYGQGLADAFKADFEAAGGEVVFSEAYTEGQASYSDLVGRAVAATPDGMLLAAYEIDGGQIVKDYSTGFLDPNLFWYFADAVANRDFVDTAGAGSFNFPHEGTVPGSPAGQRYDAFAASYSAAFGEAPTAGFYQVNIYDAVYLAALATAKAGSPDATAIRDALPGVSAGGTSYGPGEFAAAVAALAAGEDVNYEGASGSVDLDAAGDTTGLYDIWEIHDGVIVTTESGLAP